MSDSVQNIDGVEQPKNENINPKTENVDTPMESPEKFDKGKGKIAEEMIPVDDDDEDDDDEEEVSCIQSVLTLASANACDQGEGEVEEPDEDNMEEIDMDNIVGSRTRGKNIDYAQAAKALPEDDDDEEDDGDFVDDDDKMED